MHRVASIKPTAKTNGSSAAQDSTTVDLAAIPGTSILHDLAASVQPDATVTSALSQSDRDQILELIHQINAKLPFLQDLTAEERRSLLGMGDKNRIFAGKVLEVIQQQPDFLPRSFDMHQFQQNLETFDRLSTILRALTQLHALVDATVIAIGSDTVEDALTAYRHAKASGQGASLEAMMADMGQRFARKPKRKRKLERPEVSE
jgi:hypothetical protein